MNGATRAVCVLIANAGEDGGGVLSDWLIKAAEGAGIPAQATVVPGSDSDAVAPWGYVEVATEPQPETGNRPLELGRSPAVGYVDLMVAGQFVDAGRAIRKGFVTPERTTLVASPHRIFSVGGEEVGAESELEIGVLVTAVEARAKTVRLADFGLLARETGASVEAVFLGAIAESGILPVPVEAFEAGIREHGVAVEASLKGFAAGRARLATLAEDRPAENAAPPPRWNLGPAPEPESRPQPLEALIARVGQELPPLAWPVLTAGVKRLFEIRDADCVTLYLDRLIALRDVVRETAPEAGYDAPNGVNAQSAAMVLRETGRNLASWMAADGSLGDNAGKAPERQLTEDWLGEISDAWRIEPLLAIEVAELGQLAADDPAERGKVDIQKIRDSVLAPALAGHWPAPQAADVLADSRIAAMIDRAGGRLLDRVLAAIEAAR